MFQLPNKQKGFTVIEATIAIAVLAIGIVAVSNFFPFSLKIIGDSRHITIASNLALSKIEDIQSQQYDSIEVGIIESKHRLSTSTDHYLYSYQRETKIEYLDSNLATSETDIGMKKIKVTVYWISTIGNKEKNVEFVSIKSDH